MATVLTETQPASMVDRGSLQAERLFYVIGAYTMLICTAVGFPELLFARHGAVG